MLLIVLVALFAGTSVYLWCRIQGLIRQLDQQPTPQSTPRSAGDQKTREVTATFQKFVPLQFFKLLGNEEQTDIRVGQAVEANVAVLFSDIRGFSGLSEKMSPQEVLNFLNSYYERINEPIHQHSGFIDKFIGDAVMALFVNPEGKASAKATDALHASIAMRHALTLYNQHRANCNYPPINVGIGVHFGPVIMGTVGSDDRMDSTVLGDSVNTAARLESLTPHYQADIIISGETLASLPDDHPFSYRLLDWVRLKGKQNPTRIFEVLDHLPEHQRQQRLATNSIIERAIELRSLQRWDEAISVLQKGFASMPDDPVLGLHLEKCYRSRGGILPTDWDGAFES